MPKRIDVGNGYALSFERRARWCESPRFAGTVYKDGKVVGSFESSGSDLTTIRPRSVVEDFRAMVDTVAPENSFQEREAIVVYYAEQKGYGPKAYRSISFDAFVDYTDRIAMSTPTRRARAPLAKSDVQKLREARRAITFEKAHFGLIGPSDDDPLPKTEREVTEFIKRRTRLYIGSWVLPILDEMIARGERGAK